MARAQTTRESRWVGRVLRDKWRIDARIAHGGMGTVFAATHKNNGSAVAIKVLHPEFSRDSDTRSRFLQEGYAANQVNHPGVVRILDDDVSEEGLAYLVMELLEGELLEERRLRMGGKLPLTEVYEIADQLLDVLAAAHAKGIVHRDVKPENLFLTAQGHLKVLDFGFAQMKRGLRTEQTATGILLGTPGFMAPEQASGHRRLIDAQTDIWAVGATLFLFLTGEPVHAGDSAAEQLVAAANYPARSIVTLAPGLPTKLTIAVDRALALRKEDRWPSARAMQYALRRVSGKQPAVVPAPARPAWSRSSPDVDPQMLTGAAFEDATVMERVEEIDEGALVESSGDDVVVVHPADTEPPTLAVDCHGPTLAVSMPMMDMSADPDGETELFPRESTVIMETRPRPPEAFAVPAPRPSHADGFPLHPPASSSSAGGFGPIGPDESAPWSRAPASFTVVEPARPTPAGGGSTVLTLVLIAGAAMVIVILIGLLVILGAD